MDTKILVDVLGDLRNFVIPSKDTTLEIINTAKLILQEEENVLELDGRCIVVGDLHGHFLDFLNMLTLIEEKDSNIIFLGDYVDRGCNSVELMIYLLVMKIMNRDRVILLRGNHENRSQTAVYGFEQECTLKYEDPIVYWKFCEVFEYFPIVAVVNKAYFCVHGGIAPDVTLEWIKSRDRVQEYSEISVVLWGDPTDKTDLFEESQRGAGFLYGRQAVESFLALVKCKFLVRSHQLVRDGFEVKFDGKCITVWSAPNYCYTTKNKASFMIIENEDHRFVVFEATKEQYRLPQEITRKS